MLVKHLEHQTAWSVRTEGFPLIFYDNRGEVTGKAETTKTACYFEVRDNTKWCVWFYRSNSGKPSVIVFDVRYGLLDKMSRYQALGQMAQDIQNWMEPVV